jgi:hypothetical protein
MIHSLFIFPGTPERLQNAGFGGDIGVENQATRDSPFLVIATPDLIRGKQSSAANSFWIASSLRSSQ